MKSIQTVKVAGIFFIAFMFVNILVMSDSDWVDENNSIYSHVNGNVGIGTSVPDEKIHIAGDVFISGSGGTIGGSDLESGWLRLGSTFAIDSNELYFGTQAYIGTINENPLCINTNQATRILVDSNGNVGIGTTTPDTKLKVNGGVKVGNTNSSPGYNDHFVVLSDGGTAFEGGQIFTNQDNTGYNGIKFSLAYSTSTPEFRIGEVSLNSPNSFTMNYITLRTGNVGIGTTKPDQKLTVNGTIHAKKVKIDTDISADYVFKDDYHLKSLEEVENFIEENGHLPDILPGETVERNGIDVGEMNTRLLQKIEELTLYIIEQDKRITELEKKFAGIE